MRDHRPDVAISILEPLTKTLPGDYKALTLLGMALSDSGRGEEAIKTLERALKLHPLYPPALKALASSEMTLKQYDSAGKYFEQLLTVAPDDPGG